MAWFIVCTLAAALVAQSQAADVFHVSIDVASEEGRVPVPESFVGLSVEPVARINYVASDLVFTQLLSNLAEFNTGPVVIRCAPACGTRLQLAPPRAGLRSPLSCAGDPARPIRTFKVQR